MHRALASLLLATAVVGCQSRTPEPAKVPPSQTPVNSAELTSPAAAPESPAPVMVGKVEKAAGADARTVSEIWAHSASLAGKTVSTRGTVVKYNAGVIGRNWIHLQDGSGDAKQGNNDIAVTSLDGAARGETITIKGVVHTNRDFGAGYTYAVIVEDAKVVRK